MPIVNRANYSTCPSCNRWMHAPLQVLDGNRAVICQECYERADGVVNQATQKPALAECKVANPARATVKMPNRGELEILVTKWRLIPSFDDAMKEVIRTFCAMRGLEIEP